LCVKGKEYQKERACIRKVYQFSLKEDKKKKKEGGCVTAEEHRKRGNYVFGWNAPTINKTRAHDKRVLGGRTSVMKKVSWTVGKRLNMGHKRTVETFFNCVRPQGEKSSKAALRREPKTSGRTSWGYVKNRVENDDEKDGGKTYFERQKNAC